MAKLCKTHNTHEKPRRERANGAESAEAYGAKVPPHRNNLLAGRKVRDRLVSAMPNQVNTPLTGEPPVSSTDLAPLTPVGGAFSSGQSALAFRLRPDDRPPFRPALVARSRRFENALCSPGTLLPPL